MDKFININPRYLSTTSGSITPSGNVSVAHKFKVSNGLYGNVIVSADLLGRLGNV